MKIVFVSHDPLTLSIQQNFFLDQYIADGVTIEYWCVRKVVNYSAKEQQLTNEIVTDYYKEVATFSELSERVKEQPADTFFCLELWFNWKTMRIFRLFRDRKRYTFSMDWYINVPRLPASQRLRSDLKALNFGKLAKAVLNKMDQRIFSLATRLSGIGKPELVFSPGLKSRDIYPDREVVILHHHDYSIYQHNGSRDTTPPVNDQYAVFLDNMLPHHPDFARINEQTFEYASYFRRLNSLFDHVEQKTGLQVVIAAHPKSDYKQEFNGRPVIKYKTNELVKGSALVMAHQSNSIYFAVLNNKPLLLVYSDEFLSPAIKSPLLKNIYYSILIYQQLLGTGSVNMDNLEDLRLKEVDETLYQTFIRNYITAGSKQDNYDIVKTTLLEKLSSVAT